MEIIHLLFNLALILAIFSFVWGFVKFALIVLNGGKLLPYPVSSGLKVVQYLLISSICVLYCFDENSLDVSKAIITSLILFGYFVGRLRSFQSKYFQLAMFSGVNNETIKKPEKPVIWLELVIIAIGLISFTYFLFHIDLASNNASLWFFNAIKNIEKAFFFGFIFQVIAFFFMISLIVRLANAIQALISGELFKPLKIKENNDSNPFNNTNNDTHFDDYEEVE